MRLILSLVILIFLVDHGYSQTFQCGFSQQMNLSYEQSSLHQMRSDYEDEIQSIINSRSSFFNKTIPVVVHIIYNDSFSNISDAQVISALTAINEDFNAANSDFNNVISNLVLLNLILELVLF